MRQLPFRPSVELRALHLKVFGQRHLVLSPLDNLLRLRQLLEQICSLGLVPLQKITQRQVEGVQESLGRLSLLSLDQLIIVILVVLTLGLLVVDKVPARAFFF